MIGFKEDRKEIRLSYKKLIEGLISIEEPLNDENEAIKTYDEAACEEELLEALD